MVSFLTDSFRNFLPALLLLYLIQKNSLLRCDSLSLAFDILLIYHRDVLVVPLIILARVHQLAIDLLPLLQEVSRFLKVMKLHLLLHVFPSLAWLFRLECC